MHIPRLYPDEVIGGALARGCRHLGLPWARFLRLSTGRSGSSVSFLMPFALERIAQQCRIPPSVLLEAHTLFPYATAYMDQFRRRVLKVRALAADDSRISTLAHVVHRGNEGRRVCEACIEQEVRRLGEAYWHRSHLLPGVYVCPVHGIALMRTGTPLSGGQHCADSLLPIDLPRMAISTRLSLDVLESVMHHSVTALIREPREANWLERFRMASVAFGYGLRRRAVSSAAVAADVRQFFGDEYLAAVGCEIDPDQRTPWPGLMVRSEYPTRFAATKFVLMLTFFEHTLPVTDLGHAGYLKPGPQRRNYTMLDLETRRRMAVHVQLCARRRRRCTVKALIKASGQESSLHAFRERFPLTRQFLKDFRASPYAARRIRPDCAGELGCITPGSFRALVRRLIQARETSTLLPS